MTLEELESTPKFRLPKRAFFLILFLAAVIVLASSVTIYELSFSSVEGTHPEIKTGTRTFNFCATTFNVKVTVWSTRASLATQVDDPKFNLMVNGMDLGNQPGLSGAFQPFSTMNFPLSFQMIDCNVTKILKATNIYNLQLNMTAQVYAGVYGGRITRADATTWIL